MNTIYFILVDSIIVTRSPYILCIAHARQPSFLTRYRPNPTMSPPSGAITSSTNYICVRVPVKCTKKSRVSCSAEPEARPLARRELLVSTVSLPILSSFFASNTPAYALTAEDVTPQVLPTRQPPSPSFAPTPTCPPTNPPPSAPARRPPSAGDPSSAANCPRAGSGHRLPREHLFGRERRRRDAPWLPKSVRSGRRPRGQRERHRLGF